MYNENLVNLIKDKFHECLKEGISFQPAYYPNIQKKQEEKARKHFIETERDDETVLMLFDTSLFSKGKNGLALTDQAIYFKDLMGPTWQCAYTGWRIDADDAEVLLHISDKNTFLLAPFVTKLMNEICTLKKYEGLFEAEGAEQKAAEEAAKKAEEQKAAEEAAKKAAEEEEEAEKKDEDEDDDDDDDVGILDLLGVVLDVTSDPSRE